MAVYAVGVRSGKEQAVAESLARQGGPHIHATLAPDQLSSYMLVEADGVPPVETAIADLPNANKVLPGQTTLSEVESYLTPSSRVEGIEAGDRVEITDGPYAGQHGQVQTIDHNDESVTVELSDEPIPIPVSIPGDQLRSAD